MIIQGKLNCLTSVLRTTVGSSSIVQNYENYMMKFWLWNYTNYLFIPSPDVLNILSRPSLPILTSFYNPSIFSVYFLQVLFYRIFSFTFFFHILIILLSLFFFFQLLAIFSLPVLLSHSIRWRWRKIIWDHEEDN